MIRIDGSHGEGGGQILRSSLSLSAITGEPVSFVHIRAGRAKPGLMRQHLTCVKAAAAICGATVDGAEVHSQSLVFRPGTLKGGRYIFDIGSAGSILLVYQTVLPALLRADEPSEVEIIGGTHNRNSPPFDFVERCFVPLLRTMGLDVSVTLVRHGFEPAGNGRVLAHIGPSRAAALSLLDRGAVREVRARALLANLPRSIGEREIEVLRRKLDLGRTDVQHVEADGQGNAVIVEAETERLTEVFVGFGAKGTPAETVASHAAREAKSWLDSGVPVGEHLADQLLLPLALGAGGEFRTGTPTLHTTTNADIIRRFLPVKVETGEVVRVEV